MNPRTFRILATVTFLAFIAGLTLPITETAPVGAMPAGQPSILPTPCPSSCVVDAQPAVHPYILLQGEDSQVSIRIKAVCAGYPPEPLHIVLAVDNSTLMDRDELEATREMLTRLVDRLDLPRNPSDRLSLVGLRQSAVTLVPPVNDADRIKQGIARLDMEGESDLSGLLQQAHLTLRRINQPDCTNEVFNEIVVLVAAVDARECIEAVRAARALKGNGILTITVQADPQGRNSECLRPVASSPRYFYEIANAGGLIQAFVRIRQEIINVRLRYLQVVETVAEGSEVVPNSAEPPAIFDPVARTLRARQAIRGTIRTPLHPPCRPAARRQ